MNRPNPSLHTDENCLAGVTRGLNAKKARCVGKIGNQGLYMALLQDWESQESSRIIQRPMKQLPEPPNSLP